MSRLPLILGVLALTATSGLARAEEETSDEAASASQTSLVVLPYAPLFGELPQSQGDKAADFVKSELEANKQFKVVDLAEGKAKKGDRKAGGDDELAGARKEIEDANALFAKAGDLAKGKKMKPAADTLEKGIQQYLLNFQGADDFKALSDAYVQLSITRFKLGNEDEAIKLLDDVVRIDPARQFAPGEVVPLFAKLHDKARKAYLEKPRGQLKITSTPAGARVALDGRDIGETPLLAKSIVPGDHYVRVMKAGQGAWWKKVSITSGEELAVSADLSGGAAGTLVGIAKSLAANTLDNALLADVKKVGEASKAQYVLFGGIHKGDDALDLRTYALNVKEGTIALLAPLTFDVEMLGAGIEVFKLASDLSDKVKDFTGAKPDGAMQLFPGIQPAKADDTLNVVTVTAPGSGSAGGGQLADGDGGGRSGRRGPVTHVDEEEVRKPIAPVEPEKTAAEETKAPEEEHKVVIRQRGKIGEKPPEPEKKPAAKVEEEEPKITLKADAKKSKLDEVMAEEDEKPKAAEEVDLKLKKTDVKGAALSMEELKKLSDLEKPEEPSSGVGKVVLWSAVGVVGAAGLGFLGYTLLAPKTPTSATATITWNP